MKQTPPTEVDGEYDCDPSLVGSKEASTYCRTNAKDIFDGLEMMRRNLIKMTKKEISKRKKREKENLWKRNNNRSNNQIPVVIHLPKFSDRSALQTLHKESGKARDNHCFLGGLSHDWVGFYNKSISSDQSCINEWNAMDNLESKRPPSPDSQTNKEETKVLIPTKLKEIMMSVNIDDVTSKYIRQRLEEEMSMDLFKFKSFIDQEMLTILGQMDSATEIFPHVYLGSEWNASNLDELKLHKVGFILNVTKEIDNFYPGVFDYLNIRVYDNEKTELLRHWDDTYKYISLVREKGSKVLVHCKMGISRSASVVIAYAMKAYNMSLEEATEAVKKKRNCIKPNQAFMSQLKIYQGILDASRQRHNALFRSKSETNLKPSTLNRQIQRSYNDSLYIKIQCHTSGHFNIPDFKPKNTTDFSFHQHNSDKSKRPKSWSPDEETLRLLISASNDGNEFEDGIQKCRSLNDQIWHARVTLEQRSHLNTPFLIEAVNPSVLPLTSRSDQELQLSSSVKDRITEFESVRETVAVNQKNNTNRKSPDSPGFLPTVDCSSTDDFSNDSSTSNELESPESKTTVHKFSIMSDSDTSDVKSSEIIISNECFTWPAGIVKKQKEDFEVLVRDASKSPLKGLARQVSSHSLSAIEEISNSHQKKCSPETPSRNNSWGSFDSAVVLRERDTPSRQNSWGSCDTRLSNGSFLSRNSSFGMTDLKSSGYSHEGDLTCFVGRKNNINSRNVSIIEDKPIDLVSSGECIAKGMMSTLFGFVKQTKLKLETQTVSNISLERSLSSGCMTTQKRINPIARSASEKRPKHLSKINSLKRLMCSQENCKMQIVNSLSSPKTFLRSHSLERLRGDSSTIQDKRLSASSRLQSSVSQLVLDKLVVETQAQADELERDQEEIKVVKNLVYLFEENGPTGENTFPRRKVRPRSECAIYFPPVPQRKSSLDIHIRTLPCSRGPFPFVVNPTVHAPNQIAKAAPSSSSTRPCSSQVRRRKQQGKTHPLSKLAPTEYPL